MVIENLEGNNGWLEILNDFNEQRKRLDDNWQYVNEQEKWIEWRATKMAVQKIINILDDYRSDLKTAREEKFKLENPDKVIMADVEN